MPQVVNKGARDGAAFGISDAPEIIEMGNKIDETLRLGLGALFDRGNNDLDQYFGLYNKDARPILIQITQNQVAMAEKLDAQTGLLEEIRDLLQAQQEPQKKHTPEVVDPEDRDAIITALDDYRTARQEVLDDMSGKQARQA